MSNNPYSETSQAEDLIRSLVQMGCAEVHAQTLYFKITAELENGIIDVEDSEELQKAIGKAEMFREDMETYADLRRGMTKKLFDMFDGEDKDMTMWCQIKHLGLSAYQCMEAYQASEDDPALLLLAYEANKAFVKAIARFVGVEITSCAACLGDALRADLKGEEDGTGN